VTPISSFLPKGNIILNALNRKKDYMDDKLSNYKFSKQCFKNLTLGVVSIHSLNKLIWMLIEVIAMYKS
jgi:hypothetical protein